MLLTVVLGAVAVLFFIFQWIQQWSPYAKKLNAFPGPPMLPIAGHMLDLSNKTDVLFTQIRKLFKQYSETIRLWVGHTGSLHILTADDAEIILSSTKTLDKGRLYTMFHGWLGTGLLTSTGKKWQHRRKMLTPAFHFAVLRKFVEVFGDHCDNLVKKLEAECDKPKTNLVPLLTELTLTNICETAMGIQLDTEDPDQKNYINGLQGIIPAVLHRVLNPLMHADFIYFYLSSAGRLYKKMLKGLHPFTQKVIRTREANFQDADVSDFESEAEEQEVILKKKKRRLAMLDLLIYAKRHQKDIDDEGIREEVDTFVFEGHDTTAAGACLSLMVLANQKEAQENIIAELDSVFGDSKLPATYDQLQNLKYLERCLKECLRLYPSVPMVIRKLYADIDLTHHKVPADTEVFIHIYEVHRDPVYFPDPEKFDPDRFLPENSKGRHPYAYIPFSAGPRNCIGQKFAMLELKSIASSILRNYTLEPIDNHDTLHWKIDLVLRTEGPINVKFVKRH